MLLCQPKTGTTALHEALSSEASTAIRTPPTAKHVPYGTFINKVAPFISGGKVDRSKLTVVSVMREPIDWFGSWYRYNSRGDLARPGSKFHGKFTGNISFDDYLKALLLPRKDAPEYARLGGPCSVALDNDGYVGVNKLFRYTDLDALVDYVSKLLDKPLNLPKSNVSEDRRLDASGETLARVRKHFAPDFEIYDKLRPDGSVANVTGICVKRG
ncbi:hypothetical protein [Rhizobium sp. FKL33]|uniref:hypothetical protein n=1 Tax=Rhizobium sp. FKL33 TaxID=2562307 RepID=UPI0010BF745F|nr:hypothetical protein [Rhizobium sp. FKL33]